MKCSETSVALSVCIHCGYKVNYRPPKQSESENEEVAEGTDESMQSSGSEKTPLEEETEKAKKEKVEKEFEYKHLREKYQEKMVENLGLTDHLKKMQLESKELGDATLGAI